MPTYTPNRSFTLLAVCVVILVLGSGCVGPMACGPMGCNGPIVSSHGHCGSSCGDSCNGCGERYFDEWINHPPSCTDPCDSCGNFQGQSCHSCRPIFSGFKSIWGYRCDPPPVGCPNAGCDNLGGLGRRGPSCGMESCDSGCNSCGGHGVGGHHHGVMMDPVPMSEPHEVHYDEPIHSQSSMSYQPKIVRGSANVKPFQPQRSRQIFQARDANVGRGTGAPRF